MKFLIFFVLSLGSTIFSAEFPQLNPNWNACPSVLSAQTRKLPDLLLTQPQLRPTMTAILDLPPVRKAGDTFYEGTLSAMKSAERVNPLRFTEAEREIVMLAAAQWARNATRYVALRTDWNAAQKAAVFMALARIIESRSTLRGQPLWEAPLYQSRQGFVFSGRNHRLVIYRRPEAPCYTGSIAGTELEKIKLNPSAYYAGWNDDPLANALTLVK